MYDNFAFSEASKRTSSPGSRPRQLFPHFKSPDWSLNPLEKTLLQPMLKRLISVFIQKNEGLENKLTRAPLLDLAKSIYYTIKEKSTSQIRFDISLKGAVIQGIC